MATKANSKTGVAEGEDGGDAPLLDLNEASVKKLIARAKKRGYITYDELNDALPQDQMSSEQIEDVMSAISEMGVNIVENDEESEGESEEGTPDEIVASRGLAIVSDEGALNAAVDEAIAANPDVADKIRDGKHAAAGALIGAVMKQMRGQADAARVRELVLEKLA